MTNTLAKYSDRLEANLESALGYTQAASDDRKALYGLSDIDDQLRMAGEAIARARDAISALQCA